MSLRQGLIHREATDADLQKELSKWNGDLGGDLDPYCQVIVYYLRKKLSKMRRK